MNTLHLLILIVSALTIALCFVYFKIKIFRKILQFYLIVSALAIFIGLLFLFFYNYNDLGVIVGYNVLYLFPIILSIYFISNFINRKKSGSNDILLNKRINKLLLLNFFLFVLSVFVFKNISKYVLISITNNSYYTKELSLIAKYNQFGRFEYQGDSIKVLKSIGILNKETSTVVLLMF